jgi:hypothetical protein
MIGSRRLENLGAMPCDTRKRKPKTCIAVAFMHRKPLTMEA